MNSRRRSSVSLSHFRRLPFWRDARGLSLPVILGSVAMLGIVVSANMTLIGRVQVAVEKSLSKTYIEILSAQVAAALREPGSCFVALGGQTFVPGSNANQNVVIRKSTTPLENFIAPGSTYGKLNIQEVYLRAAGSVGGLPGNLIAQVGIVGEVPDEEGRTVTTGGQGEQGQTSIQVRRISNRTPTGAAGLSRDHINIVLQVNGSNQITKCTSQVYDIGNGTIQALPACTSPGTFLTNRGPSLGGLGCITYP